MEFWSRLEEIHAKWNVLEHPFYERWSAGELTRQELAVYSGEYRHAVVALAGASANAAARAEGSVRAELEGHAAEEAAHVDLWDRFANAVGGDTGRAPSPESAECADAWTGDDRGLLESLVAMYAIESVQPAISETKLSGLREHYGFAEGPATAYFSLHAERDHEHAAAERALIEPRLNGADLEGLLTEAERVLEANWRLLDGVERINGR
jgi:pyrroloquinoline-quinone synthase